MSRRYFHVVPSSSGGWDIKPAGARRASEHFGRKAEAMKRARDLAVRVGGELVIHGKDGRISETTAYPTGYGSLRGKFVVRKGIDVTKPISEQALKINKKRGRAGAA
jgi:hypothetical protein